MSARDLFAAATPRPWYREERTVCESRVGTVVCDMVGEHETSDGDAALIVAAVNEYEALLVLEDLVRSSGGYRFVADVAAALARLDAVRGGV